MKLLLEATIAAQSETLADGLVRVIVTERGTGKIVGRLSATVELWEWLRDWVQAGEAMGLVGDGTGMDVRVVEVEHRPDEGKRPQTMRGRLLEAAGEAAAAGRAIDRPGNVGGEPGGARKGKVSPLWRRVQEHTKGGKR